MQHKALIDVRGMTCSSCASGIGRHLEKKGLTDVRVFYDSGELEAILPEDWDIQKLISELEFLGYSGLVKGSESNRGNRFEFIQSLEFKLLISAICTIPLIAHMFFHWELLHLPTIQFLLCLPVMIIGWFHFGRSAWGAVRSGTSNMDVLISIGSGSAFVYSCIVWWFPHAFQVTDSALYFETASSIITLLLLGNLIERRSLRSTQAGLASLIRLQPFKAWKLVDSMTEHERTMEVDADSLRPNDLVLVQSGGQIPADGVVYEGEAYLDTSMMTGEPIHRKATVNDQVLGGTIVSEGHLKFIVKNAGAETALSRMIDVIRSSAMHKPKIQRFGDKVSAVFVPVVVLLALTTFIGAIFLANESYGASLLRAIAVLVISCPCAMGLATPTAVAVAVGYAARNGMLIKGGDILERLNAVKTIVFDKTGTLTEGSMKLELMETEGDAAYAQALIGTLEQYSTHPYAKTLHEKFGHCPIPTGVRFNEIRELKGQGVEALTTDGKRIRVGSATFTKADSHSDFQVFLTVDDKLIAKAKFSDPVRSEALAVIETLRAKGYRIVLLSGDQHATCARVAGELGIQEFFSEQLPDQKASKIKELQTQGPLVMVGDGINDAAAMAIADIGIAIGKGSSIALQTAEIVMHHEHPLIRLPELFSLAQRSMRTIRQNLFWALTYNVIAIPLAAAGMISPLLASLSMAFSDVVVIGNSLLLHIRQRFAIR